MRIGDLLLDNSVYERRPLKVTREARPGTSVTVVGHKMLNCRYGADFVEAHAAVRHCVEEPTAAPYLAQMPSQRAKQIFAVLKHVVRNDEIDRCIWQLSEGLAVVD